MDERLRFVARLLDGEKMAVLCREFDISRKTGYKIFQRYKDCGLEGLTDRSRRPYRQANQLPFQIETLIVQLKREHPSWGAPKIREKLRAAARRRPDAGDQHRARGARSPWPGQARPQAPLQGAGHAAVRPPASPTICGAPTTRASSCSPTGATAIRSPSPTSPAATCSAARRLATTQEAYAFTVFERVFKEFGLPKAIRTDNGVPFASPHALFGLSKLSVWWLRLGIEIERIKPGHPAAERPPRAHAPDPEEGSHQARRAELPAAAGQVR